MRRDRTIQFATTRRGDGITMRAAAVCDKARLLVVVVLCCQRRTDPGTGRSKRNGRMSESFRELGVCFISY